MDIAHGVRDLAAPIVFPTRSGVPHILWVSPIVFPTRSGVPHIRVGLTNRVPDTLWCSPHLCGSPPRLCASLVASGARNEGNA